MNQNQREYLIKEVESTCAREVEKLQGQIPERPSLNNYLVAAFLDGSAKFADIDALREKIRNQVLRFGQNDRLVEEDDDGYRYRRRGTSEHKRTVTVEAESLFVIPQAYLDAEAEYLAKRKKIESEIEKLEATKKTIVLKLQVGSNAVLDKIVMQVDNMASLELMNTQLLIGGGKSDA